MDHHNIRNTHRSNKWPIQCRRKLASIHLARQLAVHRQCCHAVLEVRRPPIRQLRRHHWSELCRYQCGSRPVRLGHQRLEQWSQQLAAVGYQHQRGRLLSRWSIYQQPDWQLRPCGLGCEQRHLQWRQRSWPVAHTDTRRVVLPVVYTLKRIVECGICDSGGCSWCDTAT